MPLERSAVIFDADGVLVDSHDQMYAGCCNVFRRGAPGKRPPTRRNFFRTVKTPFEDYYYSLGVVGAKRQIVDWYFEVARHDEAPLFPDVVPVLQQLARRGVWLGVVSGHDQGKLQERFQHAGLAGHFHSIVGSTHQKSEAIRAFCQTHSVPLHRAYFVGDLISDITDGRRAGVRPVGITRGNDTRETLREEGAHFCIKQLSELPDLLVA